MIHGPPLAPASLRLPLAFPSTNQSSSRRRSSPRFPLPRY
jgi:hypothetical protein